MATETVSAGAPAQVSPPGEGKYTLRGKMGTMGLVMTVLAFTAPLGVVFGFVSVTVSFGIGAPIAFIVIAGIVALFALGFTAMARAIPRPGAFYTYIREGLGRPMGLGGSFLALGTYGFNISSALVVGGIAVNTMIASFAGSSSVPWWVWTAILLVTVWVLSYFNVEMSAKVLGTILVIEVVVIAIFDIVVIGSGGAEGHSFEPWNPANMLNNSLGVMLLFVIGVFNGFEATAIYRDEVKNPKVTIPRATFITVGFLGVFYAISAYALIVSVGASGAVDAATEDATAIMPNALIYYFGTFANQAFSVLLVTSYLASMLSLQNILSRYTHSLAVDGIFPRSLAAVHPKHGSPARAALVVGGVLAAVVLVLALSGGDENALYAGAAGVAFYGMILLLTLTAIAIIVYFRRNPDKGGIWRTLVAPFIALLGIGFALLTATFNMDLLVVGDPVLLGTLLAIPYVLLVGGFIAALALRKTRPETYNRIGRAVE